MPHVTVQLWTGKSVAEKTRVAAAVTRAVMESAGTGEDSISVVVEDVAPEEWTARVYDPEIAGARPGTLLKKPGYGRL